MMVRRMDPDTLTCFVRVSGFVFVLVKLYLKLEKLCFPDSEVFVFGVGARQRKRRKRIRSDDILVFLFFVVFFRGRGGLNYYRDMNMMKIQGLCEYSRRVKSSWDDGTTCF